MGFKCGIVGLPNVGKSTLFNALTKASVEAANFPFSTIKPNSGVVPVPDSRLDQIAKIVRPKRIFPTSVEFVDIAGLIKGASNGEGLGNQFLNNIRGMDAIAHVIRCFEDENIIHIAGKINPADDIDIINTELALSDLDICIRAIHRIFKKAKVGDKNAKDELTVLEKCLAQLENAGVLHSINLNKKEKQLIRYLNFLTLKPSMYIANVNENGFEDNPHLEQVMIISSKDGSIVVPVCALLEAEIIELTEIERKEFMRDLLLEEPGLNRVIRAGYTLLNLQTYFTAGVKEVRAWTIPIGTNALKAAGKIHTDFEKGFIRAQTISFEDFITYKGEQGSKEAGKMRVEGKNYIVKDGDILNFLFNI